MLTVRFFIGGVENGLAVLVDHCHHLGLNCHFILAELSGVGYAIEQEADD